VESPPQKDFGGWSDQKMSKRLTEECLQTQHQTNEKMTLPAGTIRNSKLIFEKLKRSKLGLALKEKNCSIWSPHTCKREDPHKTVRLKNAAKKMNPGNEGGDGVQENTWRSCSA